MKTAFGLDIAGYSTGKSGFVRADKKEDYSIEITVFRKHVFADKCSAKTPLDDDIVKNEKELLIACCKKGCLLVDIPIDLQELPCPNNVGFIWELVKRPVDFAFGAMPPLAERIGSPVARFLNLFSSIKEEFPLGKQIFETYPAGSLKLLNLPYNRYKKSQAEFENGSWKGGKIAQISRYLKLTSEQNITLNDDELDAIICSITGVVDEEYCLQGDELANKINSLISNDKRYTAPNGYILLKKRPEIRINITTKIVKNQKELLKDVVR
ncbi:MAG: DUF429 domain-containing protein [Candidatus Methanoperedens sp.]|nr:DUF429 domain-containing protein [Candidatus Methanoperedens sp.]